MQRLLFLPLLALLAVAVLAQPLDMKQLQGLQARSIGPAGMSGRITAIDVVTANPKIIYAGSASGGLWKSVTGGLTWDAITDTLPVASIGAVAIDQAVPDVVWIGTGEGNPRNSQTSGNGVYKTLDGGRTWQPLGLAGTRNIHRLRLVPGNSSVAYAAAMGSAFGNSQDRGVYKTTDGGKTWKNTLFVNQSTGCAELLLDPANPDKLFAAMWDYRREPWFFRSGGSGSGLYMTVDGGANWKRLDAASGLPAGELGRIGLAISPANPLVVYALVEAKENALYRSNNGGYTWVKTATENIGDRPFYYAELAADPKNENRLYNIYSNVSVSNDGGKTFTGLISWGDRIHPDHHAFWISPENPDFLIDGNDGGLAISYDRGATWRFAPNLPLGQYYHVRVDNDTPYNVYGGLQDNGSWRGPNESTNGGGIPTAAWKMVSFGDGFDVMPDPANNRYGYSMSQGGELTRYDCETGVTKFCKPVHPAGTPLRFNWNAGIAQDPFDAATIYYGSQFLHRSTDRGDSWDIISPDLTTNNPAKQKQQESGGLTFDVTAAENHTTIVAIAPSPVAPGVVWVGTDDGNLQLTTDDGNTWTNVARNISGVPAETWIPHIHPSATNAGEALVVFDNHRRDDWATYAYRTTNYGKSWQNLTAGAAIYGYALAIFQDPEAPALIFLGTEFGMYVTTNGGKQWAKWTNGLPTVAVTDFAWQERERDLVIGTFGRSVYVLDDITPLRLLAQGASPVKQPLTLARVSGAAHLHTLWFNQGTPFQGNTEFFGANPPRGAVATFWTVADSTVKNDTVTIQVRNAAGDTLRTLQWKAANGLNRFAWDLTHRAVRYPWVPKPEKATAEGSGARVAPGTYTLLFSYRGVSDSALVTVTRDARLTLTDEALRLREKNMLNFQKMVTAITGYADKLRNSSKQVDNVTALLLSRPGAAADSARALCKLQKDTLKALLERIVQPKFKGIKDDPTVLAEYLNTAGTYIADAEGELRANAVNALTLLEHKFTEVSEKIDAYYAGQWKQFTGFIDSSQFKLFAE